MKRIIIIAIQIAMWSVAAAQGRGNIPIEEKQFDFWVGSWNANGEMRTAPNKDEWRKTTAKNLIKRSFDGRVVEEQFKMGNFKGMSVSTYNPQAKLWQQTWVDNSGSYIALEGAWKKDRMILTTLANPKAPKNRSRMVFRDIKKESFDWDWEATTDGGKSWKLMWHIRYERVPVASDK